MPQIHPEHQEMMVWSGADANALEVEIWEKLKASLSTNERFDGLLFLEISEQDATRAYEQLEKEGWHMHSVGDGSFRRITYWVKA